MTRLAWGVEWDRGEGNGPQRPQSHGEDLGFYSKGTEKPLEGSNEDRNVI